MRLSGIPIYLNRSLINDLGSLVIDGYIESQSERCSDDFQGFFKNEDGLKHQDTNELKLANNDKEKNEAKNNSVVDGNDKKRTIEGRNFRRHEWTTKKIYTSFYLMNMLQQQFLNNNEMINCKSNAAYSDFQCSKYVDFEAVIGYESVLMQVNNLMDILDCYDTKELDKLIINKGDIGPGKLNYSIMNKQLKVLNGYLTRGNTQDIIAECNGIKIIVTVNINYFWDKNGGVYDMVHENSRFLGRVTRVLNKDENISLLRKTAMNRYYEDLLTAYKPYLEILKNNGIICFDEFIFQVKYPAIQIVPLAIYV